MTPPTERETLQAIVHAWMLMESTLLDHGYEVRVFAKSKKPDNAAILQETITTYICAVPREEPT